MSTDTWLSVTNWFYLLSLFAAAVASVALWRLSIASGEQKDRELATYKVEAADRIATANATAETAKAEAARANAEAGRANEAAAALNVRATQLESDVAQAREREALALAEQERLRQQTLRLQSELRRIGPRTLSQAEGQSIVNAAQATVGKKEIVFDFASDPESQAYANQIAGAFAQGGWAVKAGANIIAGAPHGITVFDPTGALKSIMQKSGLPFSVSATNEDANELKITVGQKPIQ